AFDHRQRLGVEPVANLLGQVRARRHELRALRRVLACGVARLERLQARRHRGHGRSLLALALAFPFALGLGGLLTLRLLLVVALGLGSLAFAFPLALGLLRVAALAVFLLLGRGALVGLALVEHLQKLFRVLFLAGADLVALALGERP